MSENKTFVGQPILSQVLDLIIRALINRAAVCSAIGTPVMQMINPVNITAPEAVVKSSSQTA